MEREALAARGGLAPAVPRADRRGAWLGLVPSLAFLAGSVAIVAIQTTLAVGAVRDTGFLGARDSRWAIAVFAATALVTVLGAAVLPRRRLWLAVAPGGLALVTSLAAICIGGAEIWPLLVAALTLTASWAIGRGFLSVRRLSDEGLQDDAIVSVGVGLGILGLAILVLGRIGLLEWWTVGVPTVALGLAGAVRLAAGRSPRAALPALVTTRLRAGIAGILGLQGAFAVIWAGAPDVQFDSLWYKAWLPDLWASTGRIDDSTFTQHPHIAIAGLVQLVAVPGHAVGAPGVGRYLQLLAGAVLVALIWRLGSRFGSAAGPVAAFAFAIAPHTIWQASTAYEDLVLALLVVSLVLGILHYERHPVRSPFLSSLVIGLLAGTCIAGKLHLSLYAVAAALVWLLIATSLSDLGRRAAGLLVGGIALGLPLIAYRWLETGNPVLPYFNNVFKSDHFRTFGAITSFTSNAGTGGGGRGLHGFPGLSLLWRVVHEPRALIEVGPAGIFGLLVAVCIVACVFGWGRSPARRAACGAVVLGMLGWWLEFRYLRFALPLAAAAAVILLPALGGLDRVLGRRAAVWAALAGTAIAAAVFFVPTTAQFWNIPGGVPLRAAVGVQSEHDYLRRAIPDQAAFEVLDRLAAKDAKVVGNVWARTLLRDDIDLTADWEYSQNLQVTDSFTSDPQQLWEKTRAQGVDWVVQGDQHRLNDPRTDFLARFVAAHGQIVFADHLRDVYRLVAAPSPPRPVPLCDENFTHPQCWAASRPLDGSPGLTDREVRSEPVAQTAPACPGATYALEVTTPPGDDYTLVFFTFGQPDPEQGLRYLLVPPGGTWVMHQTAPRDASTLTIVLDTTGPTAGVERVRLAIADTSLRGSPCP